MVNADATVSVPVKRLSVFVIDRSRIPAMQSPAIRLWRMPIRVSARSSRYG